MFPEPYESSLSSDVLESVAGSPISGRRDEAHPGHREALP